MSIILHSSIKECSLDPPVGYWPACRLAALGPWSWCSQVTESCGTSMDLCKQLPLTRELLLEFFTKGLREIKSILRLTVVTLQPHANITSDMTTLQTPKGLVILFLWTLTAGSSGFFPCCSMISVFPYLSAALDYELPEARTMYPF